MIFYLKVFIFFLSRFLRQLSANFSFFFMFFFVFFDFSNLSNQTITFESFQFSCRLILFLSLISPIFDLFGIRFTSTFTEYYKETIKKCHSNT